MNAWIVNNLSLVNIFGETGRFFYNINHMLNNEHLSLVNKIGDKTEFHEKTEQLIFLFFVIYEKRKWDETLIDVRSPCEFQQHFPAYLNPTSQGIILSFNLKTQNKKHLFEILKMEAIMAAIIPNQNNYNPHPYFRSKRYFNF